MGWQVVHAGTAGSAARAADGARNALRACDDAGLLSCCIYVTLYSWLVVFMSYCIHVIL